MASTYVNDLRLNEMATGDASGTWGTTTNTNLELIAEAFSYGTEAITTNADTHTTTIADGATDPGRALYLKYTGTLDSACTITIGPNTVSKVWIIENGTSGSQDIILSQGSGANITIPAGDTKVVYSDGAGAGAAFFDAFASLSVVDLKVQDDLTVTGDIDVDGTTNLDVVDIDGAVDMASTALVTGVLTTTAATVFNGGFASNAASTISTADNLDTLSLISTDADANSGPNLRLYRNSGSPADSDVLGHIQYEGRNDNSQDVVYSEILTLAADVSDGTEDAIVYIQSMVAGTVRERISILPGEIVLNENSVDLDFRVESDTNTHALFVQGSDGNVGIGTSSPSQQLETTGNIFINAASGNPDLTIKTAGAGNNPHINYRAGDNIVFDNMLVGSAATDYWRVGYGASGTVTDEHLVVTSAGNVGIGTTAPNAPLTIQTESGTGSRAGLRLNNPFGFADINTGCEIIFSQDRSSAEDFKMAAIVSGQGGAGSSSAGHLSFFTRNASAIAEKVRITSGGILLVGTTSVDPASQDGCAFYPQGTGHFTRASDYVLYCNRRSNDGDIVIFAQDGSNEGSISVSGATVSYNGFSGNHETSGISTDTEIGTVCSTIDELDTYTSGTKEGQTRADHAKIKVSDTVGDTRVYGVLTSYSETDNKPVVASVGIGSIKVTGACSGGDLLESNGDGTAKVQSDDIVRSKTIGKVTIGNSDTGVKLVSCVLYCG
jgi:hypothetical protein